MPASKKTTFRDLMAALLDESQPFPARYLHLFSDLDPIDKDRFIMIWPSVSLRRKQSLMEDLEQLGEADDLLSFEDVCRIAIRENDPTIRSTAIRILSQYEDKGYLPMFLEMSTNDEAASVRAAATFALGTFVYMAETDLLNPSLKRSLEEKLLEILKGNDENQVRMRALEAFGYTSRKVIKPFIEEAYKHENRDWLCSALFAMGRSANPEWENKILPMLDDERPEVRSEAATAAGGIESKAAIKRLLELLDDDDIQVRLASIWALSEIGGAGIRKALTSKLEETEDDEEAQLLEDALDNLSFTEGSGGFEMLDLGEGEDGDDEDLLTYENEEEGVED